MKTGTGKNIGFPEHCALQRQTGYIKEGKKQGNPEMKTGTGKNIGFPEHCAIVINFSDK